MSLFPWKTSYRQRCRASSPVPTLNDQSVATDTLGSASSFAHNRLFSIYEYENIPQHGLGANKTKATIARGYVDSIHHSQLILWRLPQGKLLPTNVSADSLALADDHRQNAGGTGPRSSIVRSPVRYIIWFSGNSNTKEAKTHRDFHLDLSQVDRWKPRMVH